MNKEIYSDLGGVEVFAPAAPGTSAVEGAGVDLAGFESVLFLLQSVASAAGTYTVKESDDGETYTDAASTDVIGTQGGSLTNGSVDKVGYIGSKRYATIELDLSADGVCSCVATKGHARRCPVA